MKNKITKAEKREKKKKVKMLVSGKSVFKIQNIILKRSQNKQSLKLRHSS